ncbi:MAG: hypothetical protein BHV80_19680 [Phocaeicola vulgatus]|uniref:Uncharacterized protein n=1 Tax=Phocaeicola vulgatus TaxID=821 RepID=A0A1Q6INB9_PHOVU|nr:MAG: hypothetical protein BHV80_19680 [Phocaeicola vulgatus]
MVEEGTASAVGVRSTTGGVQRGLTLWPIGAFSASAGRCVGKSPNRLWLFHRGKSRGREAADGWATVLASFRATLQLAAATTRRAGNLCGGSERFVQILVGSVTLRPVDDGRTGQGAAQPFEGEAPRLVVVEEGVDRRVACEKRKGAGKVDHGVEYGGVGGWRRLVLQCQVREQVEEALEEQRRVAVPVEGRDGFRGAAPLELRAAQLPASGIVAEADGEETPFADGVVDLAAQRSGHGGVDAALAQIADQRRVANLPDAEDPQRGVFARQGGREGLEGNFVCGSFAQAPDGFCHAAPFEAHDQLEERAPFAQPEVVPKPLVVADAEAGGTLLAQRREEHAVGGGFVVGLQPSAEEILPDADAI